MLWGIAHLHGKGIAHGDLQLGNLLITSKISSRSRDYNHSSSRVFWIAEVSDFNMQLTLDDQSYDVDAAITVILGVLFLSSDWNAEKVWMRHLLLVS